jgi:signal transduction histidine kinase
LILASLLWTAGLLAVMHMLSILFSHVFPTIRAVHPTGPFVAGVVLMGAGVLGARQGLMPFRRLRGRLMAVRAGEQRRVEGTFPSEVQPLIEDLNGLLEDREKAVQRAIATAGDLAHGLKTPLALLAREADLAGATGNRELAENIAQQVERMSRQVNYHLARARAAASGSVNAVPYPVAGCVDALVRTLLKLHADRALEISSEMGPDVCVRTQREDLDEMLGNLLDNACRWARSRIVLKASRSDGMVVLTLDDDGPGLARDLRTVVLERGVRMDEAAPGSGLGLAIVRDLAELYGGSIALDESPLGGLRARVWLPGA